MNVHILLRPKSKSPIYFHHFFFTFFLPVYIIYVRLTIKDSIMNDKCILYIKCRHKSSKVVKKKVFIKVEKLWVMDSSVGVH